MAAWVISSAAFSQSTDYLSQWKSAGESWTDTPVSFQEITNDTLPEGVTYFSDTTIISDSKTKINYLYHSLSALYPETGTITWRFSVVSAVANSSTNNFKIYLFANDSLPDSNGFEAFAIGTGLKTGIYPQLCLLKYSGKDMDILAATDIMFDTKPSIKDLTIQRTSQGVWTINGETVYTEPDPQMYIADYLTIENRHTKTGNAAFNIRPMQLTFEHTGNTIEAKMLGAEIVDDGVVSVQVDGRINPTSALDVENYQINGFNPDSVHFNGKEIRLFFNTKAFNNTQLELSAKNIQQTAGGNMPDYTETLLLPMYGGIVINEIMCDVSPEPANLPAVKYIELFNPSKYSFSLKNCALFAGDYKFTFPDTEISAGEYVIVCRSNDLDSYAKTITH
ncbi:MAG: lamin tail domain-containing protein, partial [Bacteroidales bacterium]|nr:lamin tail domain-containing protein [Bacteroidales bacterium]